MTVTNNEDEADETAKFEVELLDSTYDGCWGDVDTDAEKNKKLGQYFLNWDWWTKITDEGDE